MVVYWGIKERGGEEVGRRRECAHGGSFSGAFPSDNKVDDSIFWQGMWMFDASQTPDPPSSYLTLLSISRIQLTHGSKTPPSLTCWHPDTCTGTLATYISTWTPLALLTYCLTPFLPRGQVVHHHITHNRKGTYVHGAAIDIDNQSTNVYFTFGEPGAG